MLLNPVVQIPEKSAFCALFLLTLNLLLANLCRLHPDETNQPKCCLLWIQTNILILFYLALCLLAAHFEDCQRYNIICIKIGSRCGPQSMGPHLGSKSVDTQDCTCIPQYFDEKIFSGFLKKKMA